MSIYFGGIDEAIWTLVRTNYQHHHGNEEQNLSLSSMHCNGLIMITFSPSGSTRSSWMLSMKPLLGFLQSIIRVKQNLHRENLHRHHPVWYDPHSPQHNPHPSNILSKITCSPVLRMCSGTDQGSPRSQTLYSWLYILSFILNLILLIILLIVCSVIHMFWTGLSLSLN